MNITFLDINASYSHSSLALPILERACKGIDATWSVVRGTTNEPPGNLALDVFKTTPDIILSTLYLFTHEPIMKVIRRAAVLCPDAFICLGGPEFLGNNEPFLRKNPDVSCMISGEGEAALPILLESLRAELPLETVPGICYLDHTLHYVSSAPQPAPWPPPSLPIDSPLYDWSKPFIQIESSRGCNQLCGFCTSAGTGGPDWLPIDQLKRWLETAHAHGIREVRLLDRTFNSHPAEAAERLLLFIDEFSDMQFHLEMHPAFLPESLRKVLRNAPAEMFHIEAGIQSLDEGTLSQCGRAGRRDQLIDGLSFLCGCENLAIHVDLISGLPGAAYPQLQDDLAQILSLGPDEVQIETLKVLPGTRFKEQAVELGLRYAMDPPYEVLATEEMTTVEIQQSMLVSKMIDRYYNQPMLQPVFLEAFHTNPEFISDFFQHISDDLEQPMSLRKRCLALFKYLDTANSSARWTLAYQWLLHGFSPSQCPIPVSRWHDPIPQQAQQVVDTGASSDTAKIWVLESPGTHAYFVFDKGVSQSGPISVYVDYLQNR